MNHELSDVTIAAEIAIKHDGAGAVPAMVEFWNAGALPTRLDYNTSSSSGAAGNSKNTNFQFQGQYPAGSTSQETRAEGDLRKLFAKVNSPESQRDEFMVDGNLLSAAHPMCEMPQVVEGPYAPIKLKKGQKGFDESLPEVSDRVRRAEYDDLKEG